jgi:type II secretory pathway pseudopilin PulG
MDYGPYERALMSARGDGKMGNARGSVLHSQQRGGITLLELVISISVVAVALLALMSSLITASALQDNSREKVLAYNAAREAIEYMRSSSSFSQIYHNFNATSSMNTFSVGQFTTGAATTGIQWTVNGQDVPVTGVTQVQGTGLKPIPGVPVGQIFFPSDASGALREDFYSYLVSINADTSLAKLLGMTDPPGLNPRGKDLNGDGVIDSADHSLPLGSPDYKILPVLVRIQWLSAGNKRSISEVATFITNTTGK